MKFTVISCNYILVIHIYYIIVIHQVLFSYRWFHHTNEIQGRVYICNFCQTYRQSQSPFIAKEESTETILQFYEPFSRPPKTTRHICISQSLSANHSRQLRGSCIADASLQCMVLQSAQTNGYTVSGGATE